MTKQAMMRALLFVSVVTIWAGILWHHNLPMQCAGCVGFLVAQLVGIR